MSEQLTPPRVYTAAATKEPLVVNWVPVRPGSENHEKIPSRFGNRLEYRDGKVKQL